MLKPAKIKDTGNFKTTSILRTTDDVIKIAHSQLLRVGGIPKKNEQIRLVTKKAINSFDFILAVLKNEDIEYLNIAFYRIGKKVIGELRELQESGRIKTISLLINDGFPKLVPDADRLLNAHKSKNWNVKYENNHTKIILIKTKDNHYVIEGSGNLSINARIEQYIFENAKEIYDFHLDWINKL